MLLNGTKSQVWISCQSNSMGWGGLWAREMYRGRMKENQKPPWAAVDQFWCWKFLMFFLYDVLWLLLPELILFSYVNGSWFTCKCTYQPHLSTPTNWFWWFSFLSCGKLSHKLSHVPGLSPLAGISAYPIKERDDCKTMRHAPACSYAEVPSALLI